MKNKIINLFEKNNYVQNEGVKYSKLLEQFMNPFMAHFKDYEYVDDIFEFAISAWNTANMNSILPNEDLEEAINSIDQTKEDVFLLKRMIAYKEKKFKAYTNFIVDFELKEMKEGEDPILSVATQEKEIYLANMVQTLEEEEDNLHGEDDFEENFINRTAIILKPLQPFVDWCINLPTTEDLKEGIEEDLKKNNIYLIDDLIDDPENYLKKKYDIFFMMELNEWHTNKKEWPQKRSYKMFNLWFRVEISEMIYDLEKRPVLKS